MHDDDKTEAGEVVEYMQVHIESDRLDAHGDFEVAHNHRWPQYVVVDGCPGCHITTLVTDAELIHFPSLEAFNTWARTCLCQRRYTIADLVESLPARPDGPIVRLNANCPVHSQTPFPHSADPQPMPGGVYPTHTYNQPVADPALKADVQPASATSAPEEQELSPPATPAPPLKNTYTEEEFLEKVKPWDLTRWCPGPWVEPAQIPESEIYFNNEAKREARRWTGRYIPNPAFDPNKEVYCQHGFQHHHPIQQPPHNWRPNSKG